MLPHSWATGISTPPTRRTGISCRHLSGRAQEVLNQNTHGEAKRREQALVHGRGRSCSQHPSPRHSPGPCVISCSLNQRMLLLPTWMP